MSHAAKVFSVVEAIRVMWNYGSCVSRGKDAGFDLCRWVCSFVEHIQAAAIRCPPSDTATYCPYVVRYEDVGEAIYDSRSCVHSAGRLQSRIRNTSNQSEENWAVVSKSP